MAIAVAAIGVGQREGGGAADAYLEGRVVEAGLVGQAQADDGDAPVRDRALQDQQVGLAGGGVRTLRGAQVEVGGGERLGAGAGEAWERTQLDGQRPAQGVGVHRVGEGQREGVEVGLAGVAVARAGGDGGGQQGHEAGAACAERDGHGGQRAPGVGGAELQRARPEPGPGAGLRRVELDQALRRVLRPAGRRAGVVGEQHGDGVPPAQEAVGDDARAIGPAELVQDRRHQRRGRLGLCQRRAGKQQRGEQEEALLRHRAASLGARPTSARYPAATSGGGPLGRGAIPTTAGRTVAGGASGGRRASST